MWQDLTGCLHVGFGIEFWGFYFKKSFGGRTNWSYRFFTLPSESSVYGGDRPNWLLPSTALWNWTNYRRCTQQSCSLHYWLPTYAIMDAMKCTYGCSHQCVLPSGLRHPLRPLPAAGTIPRKAQWLPSTKICSCSSITIQNSFKQHGDKWIFWQNEPTLSALKSSL